jgi:hypothetical protein
MARRGGYVRQITGAHCKVAQKLAAPDEPDVMIDLNPGSLAGRRRLDVSSHDLHAEVTPG